MVDDRRGYVPGRILGSAHAAERLALELFGADCLQP
jgi:hypothetical protein